ncbi:MAG TPA: PD-(D/E)XK nuclease family protein, partial [Enhygromyxa sp.]|nr:PD-(D/E)XK nuclease family protein [Enhygromyxa sp.]
MPELVLGLLLGALLSLWLARAWRRARMRRRFRRARDGELAAEQLLKKRGFRVLADQVTRREHMFVDGERLEYEVRADLLVSRWWRTYVVEVKTGKVAPNPRKGATRRQLREYAALYDVDGLLLADMSAGELHEIRFPAKATEGRARWMAAMFLIGAIVGVAVT